MSRYLKEVYALNSETQLYKKPKALNKNKERKLLMGTWMGVLEDTNSQFYKIYTFRKEGYVKKSDVSENLIVCAA